ncbi:nuclear transport factor 2 family protein [Sediminimonas sp.]|uniref:ester cyclase n=1 Tax=Sediminimonas sp. TaxID=2823379 RepID=UPI0025FA0F31|nr:nuclear transport factor 2 family protein [Sediminimonas sp.]
MKPKSDILRDWYARVWEDGDLAAIAEMFRPDTAANGLVPGMAIGVEEFQFLVTTIQELIEPPRITIEKTIEQNDWLAGFVTMRTRSIDRRHDLHVGGMVMVRIENDLIVEAYNSFDFISFFEQLELLPENTIAICLSGERIG